MTTDERIENLEKGLASAKRLNRWLLAAVGLALGVWILAGTFGPTIAAAPAGGGAAKEIRATHFVVVNENDKVRATLAGSTLALYDENSKPRAFLSLDSDGPSLLFLDENGRPRASLTGSKDGPTLTLCDAAGKTRAAMGVQKMSASDGSTVTYPESTLSLMDSAERPIWKAP